LTLPRLVSTPRQQLAHEFQRTEAEELSDRARPAPGLSNRARPAPGLQDIPFTGSHSPTRRYYRGGQPARKQLGQDLTGGVHGTTHSIHAKRRAKHDRQGA